MEENLGGLSEIHGEIKDHVIVEINRADEALVSSIKKKMEDVSSQVFIFRVPEASRSRNDMSFTPKKVSIGPVHHGRAGLELMEEHKWKYLASLMNRRPNPGESLGTCVKALREAENRARNCYADRTGFSSDEFVRIMLLDSCFLIELLLGYASKGLRRRADPVFSTPGLLFDLRRDIVLVENQIPFFVLDLIFRHVAPVDGNFPVQFPDLAARFFKNLIPGDRGYLKERFGQDAYHVLDMVRHCVVSGRPRVGPRNPNLSGGLDPAKRLNRTGGVRFRPGNTFNLFDLTFHRGTLRIPFLEIHDCVEDLLRNLIAFESHLGETQQTTSYACLMRRLVRSEKDVRFLAEQGILSYEEGKEKQVVTMFEKLGEQVSVKENYYLRLIEDVDEFRTKSLRAKWQKWKKGYAKRTHLSFVVFVVAVSLLVLTFVEVFLSLMSFFLHHF